LETTIQTSEELLKSYFEKLWRFANRVYVPVAIGILLVSLVLYYYQDIKFAFVLFSLVISYFIVYLVLYLVKRMIHSKHIILEAFYIIGPLIFFTSILLPILNGYLEAKQKIKTNDFDDYTIQMNKGITIDGTKFLYYGKNTYFFKIQNNVTIIPASEINLLIKK